MSVRVADRNVGKLQLLVDARHLAKYSLNKLKNEKIFFPEESKKKEEKPAFPQYRHSALVDRLEEASLGIYLDINKANEVRVNSSRNLYQKRRELQLSALDRTVDMWALIQLAGEVYHISGKTIHYWGTLLEKVQEPLKAWISSDKERYRELS